jgi:hypothetical protein
LNKGNEAQTRDDRYKHVVMEMEALVARLPEKKEKIGEVMQLFILILTAWELKKPLCKNKNKYWMA